MKLISVQIIDFTGSAVNQTFTCNADITKNKVGQKTETVFQTFVRCLLSVNGFVRSVREFRESSMISSTAVHGPIPDFRLKGPEVRLDTFDYDDFFDVSNDSQEVPVPVAMDRCARARSRTFW